MNAEDAVVAMLCGALSAPVYREVPPEADRPGDFVTVERTGGDLDRFGDRAVFAAQTWAATRKAAKLLAYEVADAAATAPDLMEGCFTSFVTSLSNYTDPESGTPRYQVVFEIDWQG